MSEKLSLKSVPLYFQKFLSSLDVKAMTTRQVGAYFLLLINSIDQTEPGYLNTDETGLMNIVKMTPELWKEDRNRVLKKFKHHQDKGYYNESMVKAITEALEKIKTEANTDKLATVNEKIDLSAIRTDGLHPLQAYVEKHFTFIRKMHSQLTYKQCELLYVKRKFKEDLIIEKLKLLENTANCHLKWNSVFLTIEDWCLKETKR